MVRGSSQRRLKLIVLTAAALISLSSVRAYFEERNGDQHQFRDDRRDRGDAGRDHAPRTVLPTGQYITPTAIFDANQQFLNPGLAGYPNFIAGEAVRSRLSPDGSTLAILTAGQNSLYKPNGTVDVANSTQYIFLYDVEGVNRATPVLKQVIKQVNAHVGLVFSRDGNELYAAGGSDDAVYVYKKSGGSFTAAAPIALGHFAPGAVGAARANGLGIGVEPNAGGMDISADGKTLVVANNYNDSISVIDTATATVRYEHDLRPYLASNEGQDGGVGGTFPYGVVLEGNDIAYVSSDRDRQVVVVDISAKPAGRLITRIKLDGNALGMTLDVSQSKLYVAQDNADQIAVIDTGTNHVVATIDARAPGGFLPGKFTGAATSAVTLSPDGSTLYAVNSGANSIAVIPVVGRHANRVEGLIPTGYEPHDITFSAEGTWMYIISGKSVTGQNPLHLNGSTASMTTFPGGGAAAAAAAADARAANQYQFQLERASLVSAPVPTSWQLEDLTQTVAQNNFYTSETSERDAEVMRFLSRRIKHVIYVVKENRTFDQMLGDLSNGANADPALAQFPQAITPNIHSVAARFVTLDKFMNPGDGSMDGWSWALQGRVTNTETLTQQINYAFVDRGLSYESEGSNRNVPVNFATVAQRDAAGGPAGTTNYSRP